MEDIDVISSVLKYLDFHELCVAERVNSTFQHCVRIELLALKHVDLAPISLENHGQIITKLDDYCPQLQRLSNCLEFLFYFPLCFSNPRREQYLPRVLSILQRLAYLDMFSPLCDVERVFKPEDCLNILVNTNNLQHLGLRTLGLCDEWRDILLRQQTLKSFSICGGFWVHLPPCVNLTSLKINFGPQWKHEQCEELYSLLAANQGLEHLRIHIFPADQLLLEKLTLLRELKTLDLAFSFLGILNCERDKVFRKSNIFLKSDVRFDHLESIAIYSQA
uniref:F-box domain-containing protein n=1 Tax=Romanomermis culicivorax TaxID=13658 RepID=A0A915KFB2_ROMCU